MSDEPREDEELLSEEVYEAFQEEAIELLHSWASICLEMEKNYEKSQCDKLFRILHTLKGSSYCVALKEYGNLVHKVEELIYFLREDKIVVDKHFISLLLDCQQLLLDWANEVVSDPYFQPDVDDISSGLQEYLIELSGEKKVSGKPGINQTEVRASKPEHSKAPDRVTMLIVDDEEAIIDLIAVTVGSSANVLRATDGKQALEIFNEQAQIDLVITDVFMSQLDGISLVRKIRESSNAPVIVMSGLMKERFQELNSFENIYTIDKPLKTGKLLLMSQIAIKNYREQELAKADTI